MSLFDRISSFFNQEAEASSPGNPALHELIERDEAELADYEHWKNTLGSKRLLNWLQDQYAVYLGEGRGDEAIGFLDTPSTKGFVIYFYQTQYTEREIQHFFHYLKERVQDLDYRVDISDRRVFSRKTWVETVERHYLKPRKIYEEGKLMEQAFGNVTILFEKRDGRPHNLRLKATVYQDALYEEGRSFRALMMALS